MSLRAQTIRLAYENPDLRATLLPLLKRKAGLEVMMAELLAESKVPKTPKGMPSGKELEKALGDFAEHVDKKDGGKEEKKARRLAFLRRLAMEHPSEKAMKEYLKEHPGADAKKHTVSESGGGGGAGPDYTDAKAVAAHAEKLTADASKKFEAGTATAQDIFDMSVFAAISQFEQMSKMEKEKASGTYRQRLVNFTQQVGLNTFAEIAEVLDSVKGMGMEELEKSGMDLEGMGVISQAMSVMVAHYGTDELQVPSGYSVESPGSRMKGGKPAEKKEEKSEKKEKKEKPKAKPSGKAKGQAAGDILATLIGHEKFDDIHEADVKALVESGQSIDDWLGDIAKGIIEKNPHMEKKVADNFGEIREAMGLPKTPEKEEKSEKKQKGGPKKEKSKAELIKDYKEAIQKSDMAPEDKKKALEQAKKPNFDPEAALGAMGDDDEEGGKQASLRGRAIKLAHRHPELRADLLRLLTAADIDVGSPRHLDALQNGIKDVKSQIKRQDQMVKVLSDIASPLGPKAVEIYVRKEKAHLDGRKQLLKALEAELKDAKSKKKADFDPENVGAESDGPLKSESDEAAYMEPNFSAQIFRELSDRQEAGQLSDGKGITEQRDPQPGRKGITAMNLRTAAIKLAYENPELRAKILPLLKTLDKSAGRNPFPDLKRYFRGAVQAAFPGPYDPKARDVIGGKDTLSYWTSMFGDSPAGWSKYTDIAIIAGDDGESLDMVYRQNASRPDAKEGWYWGAGAPGIGPWLDSRGKRLASFAKLAHEPYLKREGLTKSKVGAGEAHMFYLIDAEKNNSKFYEVLVVENPQGSGYYDVMRRWGALTDRGAGGRVDGEKYDTDPRFSGLSYREAIKNAAGHAKKRLGKKPPYISAYGPKHINPTTGKKLPMGQYPIGLVRGNAGFGWGSQAVTSCLPGLRQLQESIQRAISEAVDRDTVDLINALQEANSVVGHQIARADSTMAGKIQKLIRGPMMRAKGAPRFLPDADGTKITKELRTLDRYLTKQMAYCG